MLLAPVLAFVLACSPDAALDSGLGPDTGGDSGADTGPVAEAPTAVDLSPLALTWHEDAATGIDAEHLRVGIDWNLAQLGALPPADGSHLLLDPTDGVVAVTLDLALAGFPERAHTALTDALLELRAAPEPLDVGRFFLMTLHEPWRYYGITGACQTLDDWAAVHEDPDEDRYDVVLSLLAGGDRQVFLSPEETPISEVSFSVLTSTADLGDDDWHVEEFETIDLLANGQQRFAAYDAAGAIQPGSDAEVVPAGQPARCMWCHEGNLMLGTWENPSTADALSYAQWEQRIVGWQADLEAWRRGLDTSVVFGDVETHTQGELVVHEFHRPTVARAASEWGLSVEEAEALIAAEGLFVEEDEEWAHRGEVLVRSEVDAVLAAREGWTRPGVLEETRLFEGDEALRGEEWAGWLDCGG